ncbi:MotA/TolQ/ExbB proton channel family protein [Flammeovirga sp. SubArs3]|uniref:MotA/TolQ/ExbB proton channel family protein n=1 Tax=Flammeovirga sp. SubArs3 TaxID=2995316 RepID=UPI00248CAB86|nr:MotA/TolQ/ExbB proton channel family protein [Flammeovirga sp. SubArs3]
MTSVTNILYWISTGLLIPVIAILLFSFVKSLLLLGGFFGMFINRLKYTKEQKEMIGKLNKDISLLDSLTSLKGNKQFSIHLERIVEAEGNEVVSEKSLADFEVYSEKELSSSKSLGRIGPMIGLMGTLIPMGPALAGLASGDIASMAQNMQVAFSTTVVGIFIGGIGYVTQLVKQRWFVEDLNNLEYIHKLTTR